MLCFFCTFSLVKINAQVVGKDTVLYENTPIDTAKVDFDSTMFAPEKKKKPHDPHKATMHSLMLPGWGQWYNKQYWKVPIVIGGIAIPTVAFIQNAKWFNEAAKAYKLVYGATYGPAVNRDSSFLSKLPGEYQTYWNKLYASRPSSAGSDFLSSVQGQRNYYRRNKDYAALWFFILWGINVADATVFGHLKDFDISPNLSMTANPTYFQMARVPGVSFIFNWKYPNKTTYNSTYN